MKKKQEEKQPVTMTEMLNAINILRRVLEEIDVSEDKFSVLNTVIWNMLLVQRRLLENRVKL